jgi:hypothetical protein
MLSRAPRRALRRSSRAAVVAALALSGVLTLTAPAGAATYRLSGRQIAVDADNGVFKMNGSLVGDWNITRFDTTATSPLLQATGTEQFKGCLDRRRDGCDRRDPTGGLSFTFTYEALFASPDPASLVWGSCRHPIVSGTGGFAGAKGVIAMVDTPNGTATPRTDYIGNLTLAATRRGAHARGRASATVAAGAVPTGACG